MRRGHESSGAPHLLWAYDANPAVAFGVTTQLEVAHELRNLGWRVTLILKCPATQRSIRGIEVLCFQVPEVFFVGYFAYHMKLLRHLMQEWSAIDIILFHQRSAPWIMPLTLLRRFAGRPRPLFVMDTRTLPMAETTRKDRLRACFLNLMNLMANRWVDGQTAITTRMVDSIHIPSEKLLGTWPCGVNLARFTPAQISRRWPKDGDPIRLIYVGALHIERNLMPVCQAVQMANAEGMRFQLLLLGDGTQRLDLEILARRSDGRIRVGEPVPHVDVPRLLAESHIGVLPFPDEKKFQVSSPMKLFEYMAAGLPILATRIACHTDVVREGEFAFWVDGASVEGFLITLRAVWQNRRHLVRMGSEAAIASHAWTWSEAAIKLKTALEHAL